MRRVHRFVNHRLGQCGNWRFFRTGITGFVEGCLVSGFDVVRPHKFLGEFNAFTVGVRLSIPPAVLIKRTKRVHQDNFPVGSEGEFLLSVHVNQTVLGCFSLDDLVDGEGCGNDFLVFFVRNVGDFERFFSANVPVKGLKLGSDFNERLRSFTPYSQSAATPSASAVSSPRWNRRQAEPEIVAYNDFQRDKDPLHVSRNRTGFLDDLDFANQASVGCVDFDEVVLQIPASS